jgi:hypothetical protein
MEVVENITVENWIDSLQSKSSVFAKKYNLKLRTYRDQYEITDLTNAHKRAEKCIYYSVDFRYHPNFCALANMLRVYPDIKGLWNYLEGLNIAENEQKTIYYTFGGEVIQLQIYHGSKEAIRCFNPETVLNFYKPLKEIPKKWNIPSILRALLNGQFEALRCKGVYTDDYAYDNAVNYQEGALNALKFAERIIKSPSGWSAWDNDGKVSVCCYHFDNNEFIPKLT